MKEKFNIKGEWFLPSNPSNKVHGTLVYDPQSGADLDLYGTLDPSDLHRGLKDEIIIHGISSDSKKITLYRCFMTQFGGVSLFRDEDSGKPSVSYSILYTLIGIHIDSPEDLTFDTISCEIFNLDEWVGISGFQRDPDEFENMKNKEVKVHYKLPSPVEFEIDDNTKGRFNFTASHPGGMAFRKNLAINQAVAFEAIAKTDKNISELLDYVISFQNFLILALYQSTYPTSIILSGEKHKNLYENGKSIRKSVLLYVSSRNFKENEKSKLGIEMIFNYRKIEKTFPARIKNWFAKYELLEPAFDLLFEQFYNDKMFTVNTFLNLAQAAETFHARVDNHTKMPKADYTKMKDEILNLAPKVYHEWLNEQFNFGNNLNLQRRLTEIADKYSNEIVDIILSDKSKFVLQVKHSRNYYTHYSDSSKKKALKGSDLFYLSQKLKILLVCAFLMEVGFEKEELSSSLSNLKWKLFSHLADWKKNKVTEVPAN